MNIPDWNTWFMQMVYLVASKSKDTSSKIGAVVVRDHRVLATGYNGMPVGVNDSEESRYLRPEKYFWFEHAERNTIFQAAKFGIPLAGAIMFTQGTPCADCARAIIQAGITEVIVHSEWESQARSYSKWSESADRSITMFAESGVKRTIFTATLGIKCLKDHQIISV